MLSTCTKNPPSNKSGYWPGLIQVEVNLQEGVFWSKPKFSATPHSHREILFPTWWNEVIYWGAGKQIRRDRLILDASNKDGGAHVDSRLPENYDWMVKGTQFSLLIERNDGIKIERYLSQPHLASIRQIAFEVLNSPELLRIAEPRI